MTEKEKLEIIENLRPIDDIFFEALASDMEVCEEILRVIMNDNKRRFKKQLLKNR